MARKKVFISFDYDNDRHYKNLLLAWDKNDEFDFELYDGSLKESINSTNAAYIKSLIRPKIKAASHFLCIVGKETSKSEWIEWEIDRAIEGNKKLIGVKIEKDLDTPSRPVRSRRKMGIIVQFRCDKKSS
jgi:Thoeris protein ThsB, TIR-like domain